jgi:hypothetical protein
MFIAPFIVEDNSYKTYVLIMLSISIIVALLMTACGFTFTIGALLSKGDGFEPLIYIISIPSGMIGVTFLWLSIKKFIKLKKKHNK